MFHDPEYPGHARVPNYLWRYAQDHSQLADAADELKRFLGDLAVEASIPVHSIEARAKTLRSYQDKTQKIHEDGTPRYPDPASAIQDCVAARVILYTPRARNDFADIIESRATVVERRNPGDEKHNGYDSEHLIINAISDSDSQARHRALTGFLDNYPGMEIQLRSVAAHAWAEYEHDVRYKPGAYQDLSKNDRGKVDQWFVEAGGLRRFMDELFDKIDDLLHPQGGDGAPPVDSAELPVEPSGVDGDGSSDRRPLDLVELRQLVEQRFPEADVGDSVVLQELIDHLGSLEIAEIARLESSLSEIESDQVFRLMDYPKPPTGARRLDDELLATFTDRYVETTLSEDRKQLLRLRLRRVRGKFAIYSIHAGDESPRVVPAARAVRDLAAMVADRYGISEALVEGAIAENPDDLRKSGRPVAVQTKQGVLHVAANLSRSWAEEILLQLISRAFGSQWRVIRAGDVLAVAPPDGESGGSPAEKQANMATADAEDTKSAI